MVSRKVKILALIVILAIIIFTLVLYIQLNTSLSETKVVNINTELSYTTIQKAINASETKDGDTLLVYPGLYRENIVVNKSLTIMGTNREKTIIEREEKGVIVLFIQADNVTVANLTVQNSVFGIWSRNGINNQIVNNTVINCVTSVQLEYCSNCTVKGNKILDGKLRGIWLYHSKNSVIFNNYVARVINETGYGAVHLEYSNYTTIMLNHFVNNSYSLWLESSSHNMVYHNNFVNSSRIKVFTGCVTNAWDDGYPSGGNYWSDYNGVDADGDGIGDASYEKWGIVDQYPLIEPLKTWQIEPAK